MADQPFVLPPREASARRASQTPGRETGGAAVMEKAPERLRKPSPRYRVLLHNDPVNTMEYVVKTLRQVVPSLSEDDAFAVMMEAHRTGVGLVIVCDLEPAEFYCETLKAKGLTSTIEPEE
jgi:ATP-dependent Clp protease adaptor protein ClpS